MFADHGLIWLDADRAAREVTDRPEVIAAIRARFGEGVIDGRGGLDRAALAELVFRDRTELRALEAITHPAVRAELLTSLERAHAAGASVILDVPLLIEGGLIDKCDVSVFVDADESSRRERATKRGWDDDELARRESNQAELSAKRARCRYTVGTSGSLTQTRDEVAAILAQISVPPASSSS